VNTHIVIVNWNNAPQTLRCLRSLQDLEEAPKKIWVVDNGSQDQSVDRLSEFITISSMPIELLRLTKNLGFGGGCNLGMRKAFAEGADSVWLLNNDAVADRRALQALQQKLASAENIGAVGSVIYDLRYPKRVQVWGGGRIYRWAGVSSHFCRPVADEAIDYLTGASLLLRRSAIEAVGFFDEDNFFMYWEDSDLCLRLRGGGWGLAVAANSRIWHEHSSSLGRTHALKDYYVTRSAGIFTKRYAKLPRLAWFIGTTLRILRRVISGQATNWFAIQAAWKGEEAPNKIIPVAGKPKKNGHTLRIAVEASTLEGKRAGIGHYTEQLSEALSEIPGVEIRYFTSHSWGRDMPGQTGLAPPRSFWTRWKKSIPLGRDLQLRLQGRQLARMTKHWAPNVVLGPNYVLPASEAPQVLVVHDLSHLRHPEFHPPGRVRFLKRYLGRALARAEAIITVSNFTKSELLHFHPEVTGRVHVIYPGISERFRRPPTVEQERALDLILRGEQRRYLLFLSTLEPRKNIARLLLAYQSLPDEIRERHPLVMTGQMGWQESQFAPLLRDLIGKGEVILTGYIRDELLPALYHRAQALLYPSLYEGFGLPPLEAMACGCPVLVSNVTSMPEVCGEDASYCDPLEVDSIRKGIISTLSFASAGGNLEGQLRVDAPPPSWVKSAVTLVRILSELNP
jgi:GT2 family glycosyltransferase/glycosyltransferase involved in cell wall biosynthesis